MTKQVLSVPDISCDHCVRTVTETLEPLEGIRSVLVDIPSHSVAVDFDENRIGIERIKQALLEEEYPVAGVTTA